MALLPYALRPKVIIRRKAIWSGLLGPSTFWKVVAVWVLGKDTIKRAVGKNPEALGTFSVATDNFVNVINAKPLTKKQQKQLGITKATIAAAAEAAVRQKRPDAGSDLKM